MSQILFVSGLFLFICVCFFKKSHYQEFKLLESRQFNLFLLSSIQNNKHLQKTYNIISWKYYLDVIVKIMLLRNQIFNVTYGKATQLHKII